MEPRPQVRHQTQGLTTPENSTAAASTGPRVFEHAEELLRHDRDQTEVPDRLASRLAALEELAPSPSRTPWWKRWWR